MGNRTHRSPAGARIGPLLEAGGLWLLIVLAGTLLIAGLLTQWRQQELQEIERAQIELTLRDLQDELEADLALGMELQHNPHIQALLQRQLDEDPQLYSLEVLGPDGRTLFSTDRASVGEPLPPAAQAAARQGAAQRRPWHAEIGSAPAMGVDLRSAYGETAGHVSASYASHAASHAAGPGATVPLLLALLAMALGGLAAVWLATQPQRRLLQLQSRGGLAQAQARLEATRARLDEGAVRLDAVEQIE